MGHTQPFPDLEFSQLSEKNGLSGDDAVSITRDKDGFIWIATSDGLNRYDGYQIRKFFHHPDDSASLANNNVGRLTPDGNGNMWIATSDGICYYDKPRGGFVNLKKEKKEASGNHYDHIADIYVDPADNDAWASGYRTFYHFSHPQFLSKQLLRISVPNPMLPERLPQNATLYEDRSHHLWAYDSTCLFQLGQDKTTILHTDILGKDAITSFYQDRRGNFWVGTLWGGLFSFDPSSHFFHKLDIHPAGAITSSITGWTDMDHHDWIVLGTERGITLVDPETHASKDFLCDPFNSHSLIGSETHCVFTDKQNILWVATDKGVSYIEPSKQFVSSRSVYLPGMKYSDPMDPGFLYNAFPESGYYYGSNFHASGLFRFSDDGPIQKIKDNLCPTLPDSQQIYTSRPYGIMKRPDGFWYSTDLGMVHFDPLTKRSVLYRAPYREWPAGLRNIVPYNDSLWFIRSRNNASNGIYTFNPRRKKFTAWHHYVPGCVDCLPPRILDMILTTDHHIYTCPLDKYIYTYDSARDKFVPLMDRPDDLPFPAMTFNCLAAGPSGDLWIGTPNGLLLFDPVHRKILWDYSQDNILGGVGISAICLDAQQNVWMTTERGLFCLVSLKGQVLNFTREDGLPTNSFPGFLVNGKDGNMFAGAMGWLVKFNPSALLHRHSSGEVHFSDATVMNSHYPWQSGNDRRYHMTLSPQQNIFSVDYAVLNYDHAEANRYYYMLEGLNNEWKEKDNGHLDFYDLPPGKYKLHVKGGNEYGGMFPGEDSISIVVQPAWWQTAWFRLLAVCSIISMAAWLVRRRGRTIRREASIKQKIAETEMMALRAQMNPHFIFNSMNSIENFIMQNEKRLASDYLNKFARLIRIILDSSRIELVELSTDMEALQLYVDLEQLRFSNKFAYETRIDPVLLQDDYKVPPLLIQPFVENAIVHGLAHSDKTGLFLRVSAIREGDFILYSIEDNGIGRRRAGDYNRQYKAGHESVGLLITQRRIDIFNRRHPGGSEIRIIDLYDDQDQPAGTKVQIKLKPA
jgi:streptogramin lyase